MAFPILVEQRAISGASAPAPGAADAGRRGRGAADGDQRFADARPLALAIDVPLLVRPAAQTPREAVEAKPPPAAGRAPRKHIGQRARGQGAESQVATAGRRHGSRASRGEPDMTGSEPTCMDDAWRRNVGGGPCSRNLPGGRAGAGGDAPARRFARPRGRL